jgi:hypothetical protein
MFYDDLKCHLCNKSGGLMMKTVGKSLNYYYHPFCAYFVGRHHELESMSGFRLKSAKRAILGQNECYICGDTAGISLQCSTVGCLKYAHAHCLWLDGTIFEQTEEKASCMYDSLDVQVLRSSRVRSMLHAIGQGTNGWYFDDPAHRLEFKHDEFNMQTLHQESMQETEHKVETVRYESSGDEDLEDKTFNSQPMSQQGLLASARTAIPYFKQLKVKVTFKCTTCAHEDNRQFLRTIRKAKFTP